MAIPDRRALFVVIGIVDGARVVALVIVGQKTPTAVADPMAK